MRISEHRFHDFVRTMDLNYVGALRLILGLVSAMRRSRTGDIINVSSVGAQVGPPPFSAYVGVEGRARRFLEMCRARAARRRHRPHGVYMPLLKTEMSAPSRLYESFAEMTPAQAADLICSAVVHRPKQVSTQLGRACQIGATWAPSPFDVWLHVAYRLFPDSAATRGELPVAEERPASPGRALARGRRGETPA